MITSVIKHVYNLWHRFQFKMHFMHFKPVEYERLLLIVLLNIIVASVPILLLVFLRN